LTNLTGDSVRKIALLTLMLACAQLAAQAANDPWEPNNSASAAAPMWNHIGPSGTIAGLGFNLFNRPLAAQLVIVSGDQDWFRIGSFVPVPTGEMRVFLNQMGETAHRLQLQVTDSTLPNPTVLVGPGMAGYQEFEAPPVGAALYDGARAALNVTGGSEYLIRVYHTGTIPSGVAIPYQLSVEFGPYDSAEGTYSNNFPGFSPAPGFTTGNPANATPSGYGSANAKTYTSMSWNGWDYYMVHLTSPAIITVDLGNFTNLATPEVNFDLYWVRQNGQLIPASLPGEPLAGATDTFPLGWPGPGIAVVATPNTSEQIVTPPLAPGTYYFQVHAWDLSDQQAIDLFNVAGNYDITFTLTQAQDDGLEGSAPNYNNTAQHASPLPAGTTSNLRLLFHPDPGAEEDWYRVAVPEGGNLSVRMTLDGPATDHINIRLYKPNATEPGRAEDLIDAGMVNNTDTATKGGPTASEIVGTWGTVGVAGNTGLPSGDYLVRISRGANLNAGGVTRNQVYSLNVNLASPINIAPDDAFEPNNSVEQVIAAGNTYLQLQRGLTTGLKAMNAQDWFRVTGVQAGQSVVVSLIYDGGSTVDLDLIVFDLNSLQPTGNGGRIADNFANENSPLAIVQASGTAGTSYATPPGSGTIYILVQRWNSVAAPYSLNVNIANADPLPTLRMNSINVNPTTVNAGNSFQVTVAVENLSATAGEVSTLGLSFVHSSGANLGFQYDVAGVTPSLPAPVGGSATQNITFNVDADSEATNGTISVHASGTDQAGKGLLGSPVGSFTLAGGQAPGPNLRYDTVTASGTTQPGGTLTVSATFTNYGTATGMFGDIPAVLFAFDQSGADVSGMFTGPSAPNRTLPLTLAIGQTESVSWTFSISSTISLGPTRVVISGGGPDNPTTEGAANFSIRLGSSSSSGSSGGCSVGGPVLPWLVVLAAVSSAALLRRRARRAD
jgi:hypothetical protein